MTGRPCGLIVPSFSASHGFRPVRLLMGTWATWTSTRFERVKVCGYSTFIQGLELTPHRV